MTCRKFDDTPPTASDISNINTSNLLANNAYNYVLSVNANG
jgi:hypothetical protein